MTAISPDLLISLSQRRAAGEKLSNLATEVGLTWQRLWGMLYAPTQGREGSLGKGPAAHFPTIQPSAKDGPLTERYRPTSLDALWGQEAVVNALRKFVAKPYPAAFIFEGETGTGKTSAALALAAGLGCRVDQAEYGGVWQIASGEQTADAVREMSRRMWLAPLMGSGWKVIIVNECDRMARPAEMIWLDVLENLPRRAVVVFTTNDAANLSERFRDRCSRLSFESDGATLRATAAAFAAAVWKAETGRNPKPGQAEQIVAAAESNEKISFRRVVQELATALAKEPQ